MNRDVESNAIDILIKIIMLRLMFHEENGVTLIL